MYKVKSRTIWKKEFSYDFYYKLWANKRCLRIIIIINNNLKYLKNYYYYVNYNKNNNNNNIYTYKKDVVDVIRKNIIFYAKINKKN